MRNIAIRKAHLTHLGFRNFQHRIARQRIRWKIREPILISLACLNQRARGALEIKGVGNRQLSQRQVRRIRIGSNDCSEKKPASLVISLAHFPGCIDKQHPVATRSDRASQFGILIVTFAGQQPEKATLTLFRLGFVIGRGGTISRTRTGGCLQCCINAILQFRD